MVFLRPILLLAAASTAAALSDVGPSSSSASAPACTATSSSGSGAFFDLRPDTAVRSSRPGDKPHKGNVVKDYHARGYDYGNNFTMNICGSVVDPVADVVGIDRNLWANVSAYYISRGKIYSIGSQSVDLHSRGRKLVLQYTGGSPCTGGRPFPRSYGVDFSDANLAPQNSRVPVSSPDWAWEQGSDSVTTRRKSTIISFLCDRDPGSTQASISFVGTDPEECVYFFEARSVHACAHAEPHKPGSVGPGSVFGIILVIAVLVYLLGGVFYNRAVAHARGWRQLPNYSLWAGIWGFVSALSLLAWNWCAVRFLGRRGYSYLHSNNSSRGRSSEAENRLIDQLDEEWDD